MLKGCFRKSGLRIWSRKCTEHDMMLNAVSRIKKIGELGKILPFGHSVQGRDHC